MNVLAQVAAFLRICFVGSCQTFKCGTKLVQSLPVEAVLICLSGQSRFLSSLNQGSRQTSNFLTELTRRFRSAGILVLLPVKTPGHLRVLAGSKGAAAIVRIERRGRTSDSTADPLRSVYVRIFLGILRRKHRHPHEMF